MTWNCPLRVVVTHEIRPDEGTITGIVDSMRKAVALLDADGRHHLFVRDRVLMTDPAGRGDSHLGLVVEIGYRGTTAHIMRDDASDVVLHVSELEGVKLGYACNYRRAQMLERDNALREAFIFAESSHSLHEFQHHQIQLIYSP